MVLLILVIPWKGKNVSLSVVVVVCCTFCSSFCCLICPIMLVQLEYRNENFRHLSSSSLGQNLFRVDRWNKFSVGDLDL